MQFGRLKIDKLYVIWFVFVVNIGVNLAVNGEWIEMIMNDVMINASLFWLVFIRYGITVRCKSENL